jgi:Cd2+/Zn2+-exporting ATPase
MDCADEAALVRRALNRPGIHSLNFDLVGRRVDVTYDPAAIPASAILEAVAASGVLLAAGWVVDGVHAESWTEAVFGNHGESGHAHHPAAVGAYAVSAVAGLWPMVPRAFASLRFRRLDMHVLVCLSAAGAAAVGQWAEAATVAFLFALAHLLEAWSIDRARQAVATLVGHEPGWADERGHESAAASGRCGSTAG